MLAASFAVLALAASLTSCTASVGGYVAVAVDQGTDELFLVVRLCDPTKALELDVKIAGGEGTSVVVWSAKGAAGGHQVVLRVGKAPAGWTTAVDVPVPASRKLYVTGWTDLDDDDSSAFDLRLVGPAFVPDELPLTAVGAPGELVYDDHNEPKRGSLAAFTAAATGMCAE